MGGLGCMFFDVNSFARVFSVLCSSSVLLMVGTWRK